MSSDNTPSPEPSPTESGEVSSTPTKSSPPKSSFGPARIILLVVLLGAIAVLAWDYMARSKYHAAQEAAQAVVDMQKPGPKDVVEKLGREPDETVESETPKKRSDFYRFETAFYVYSIEFKYRWISDANGWMYTGFAEKNEPRFWTASEDDEDDADE